ncbi:MAG: hypothetical protein CH6_0779 [Candidatus Kapaibacterium sp.]|nr:MAG: hypothetical protein CH6_0779 [Candidatus Kapabacteria bacterium]
MVEDFPQIFCNFLILKIYFFIILLFDINQNMMFCFGEILLIPKHTDSFIPSRMPSSQFGNSSQSFFTKKICEFLTTDYSPQIFYFQFQPPSNIQKFSALFA